MLSTMNGNEASRVILISININAITTNNINWYQHNNDKQYQLVSTQR